MEIFGIIIIAIIGLYAIFESIYWRKRLIDAETAYKYLAHNHNELHCYVNELEEKAEEADKKLKEAYHNLDIYKKHIIEKEGDVKILF